MFHALKEKLLKNASQDILVFTPVGNADKEKVLSFALKRYAYDVRASSEPTLQLREQCRRSRQCVERVSGEVSFYFTFCRPYNYWLSNALLTVRSILPT